MPTYASQPVSCWRRVSFSAATYSACSWPSVRSSPNQPGISATNVSAPSQAGGTWISRTVSIRSGNLPSRRALASCADSRRYIGAVCGSAPSETRRYITCRSVKPPS